MRLLFAHGRAKSDSNKYEIKLFSSWIRLTIFRFVHSIRHRQFVMVFVFVMANNECGVG